MALLENLFGKVVYPLLEDLSCPRSLTVEILMRYGEWEQLVNLRADPSHYEQWDDYLRAVAATELLRKADFLETGIDTKAVALEKWFSCEKQCALSNVRLSPFLHNGPFDDPSEMRIFDILSEIRNEAGRILGSLPATLELKHGPGTTYYDTSDAATVPDKMTSKPSMTSALTALIPIWERTAWYAGLVQSRPDCLAPTVVRGNRFIVVPKDATTGRPIAIESSLNVSFQLAVGGIIRSRLARFGLNLVRGQTVHSQMACEASKTGEYATIDLSSASDTISRNVVKLLIPENWYELLDMLRSRFTTLEDGRTLLLEKFSSMGNGFTFELETMLFACIAVVACRHSGIEPVPGKNLLVYGDDIIVPTEAAENLLCLLKFLGFTPNLKKTFVKGNFRESCGGDFFCGKPVRAHYIKEEPNDPAQWITLANGLRRMATQFGSSTACHPIARRAWFGALARIPSNIRRCRGPVELGDVVIHDLPSTWDVVERNQISYIKIWRPITKPKPLSQIVIHRPPYRLPQGVPGPVADGFSTLRGYWPAGPTMAAALYGIPSAGVSPRDSVAGYRFGRSTFQGLSEEPSITLKGVRVAYRDESEWAVSWQTSG